MSRNPDESRHVEPRGDSRPRLSGRAQLDGGCRRRNSGAPLRRTAGAGCPHPVLSAQHERGRSRLHRDFPDSTPGIMLFLEPPSAERLFAIA